MEGKDGNGDIMNSSNIEEFQNFVLEHTDDKGVHFVTGDGVSDYVSFLFAQLF